MPSLSSVALGNAPVGQRPSVAGMRPGRSGELPDQMSRQLDGLLASQGANAEQRSAIETDVRGAIQRTLQSGQFPPDPPRMETELRGILEKHGVDADATLAPLKSSSPFGTAAPSNAIAAAYGDTDPAQTLLDLLADWSQGLDSPESATIQSEDWTNQLLSRLLGTDVTV